MNHDSLYSSLGIDKKQVALAHDFLLYSGGAERVISEMANLFPESPIYTLKANKSFIRNFYSNKDIRVSYKKGLFSVIPHRWILPFFPTAVEDIDLRNYGLVISSSGSFMKGLVTKPRAIHISYCHSPTRYLWDWNQEYLMDQTSKMLFVGLSRIFLRGILNYLRIWDQLAAKRVDAFIANSRFTAKRIKKYYNRNAIVVYPPVAIEKFHYTGKNRGYFLVVSRLSRYKKVSLVVEAFNRLGWPLVVVGEGEEKNSLKKIARNNIRFLGYVKDRHLPKIYSGCRAFIFPGEDDFGITMVEALASGKPVLAYGKGGALEIIEKGKTGEFFNSPDVEILIDGLRRIVENKGQYSAQYIHESSLRFSRENFRKNFEEALKTILAVKKI